MTRRCLVIWATNLIVRNFFKLVLLPEHTLYVPRSCIHLYHILPIRLASFFWKASSAALLNMILHILHLYFILLTFGESISFALYFSRLNFSCFCITCLFFFLQRGRGESLPLVLYSLVMVWEKFHLPVA